MKPALTALLFCSAAAIALPREARTEGSRELGAHEHGHGSLAMAVDNGQIGIELEAPGADIVGFEHPAESAEDRAAVDSAVAVLSNPLELFLLANADCEVIRAEVELVGEHHEEHMHDDDHGHDEDHAEDDDHAEDEDHDEDHAHDESADESHTKFHASYLLTCARIGA